MKILITGGTGFVGQSLIPCLQSKGDYRLQLATRLTMGEFSATTDWQSAVEGCDGIIHLAARVHVMRETAADPLAAFREVNVAATLNLAKQAAAAGVRRFIFLSSIKVNGEATQQVPFFADDVPAPLDAYGVSKWEAEQQLHALSKASGMEVVIIRPPLIYGPQVKGNFQSLIKWLKKGIPLPLGAVNNRRSLVAIENLIDLIETCLTHPNAAGHTFLVSDGEDLSTTALLQKLGQALDKPARLLPVPYPWLKAVGSMLGQKEVMQRLGGSLQVDIDKTKTMLNWHPPVSIDTALTTYFRERKL